MELRRSRWILGAVLATFAFVSVLVGADEPNFTEEQKIDFMQHAKVIASQHEKKGKSDASHSWRSMAHTCPSAPIGSMTSPLKTA